MDRPKAPWDGARRLLAPAVPLAFGAGLELSGYENHTLARLLLVSVVPIAAWVAVPEVKRLLHTPGLSGKRWSTFVLSMTILVLALTLAAWRSLEPERPCPRADHGQRTEYLYPASHTGDVYVTVRPAPSRAFRDHSLCLQWGPARRDVALTRLPPEGRTLVFRKMSLEAIPLSATVEPSADVAYGVGRPDGSVDINTEWHDTED